MNKVVALFSAFFILVKCDTDLSSQLEIRKHNAILSRNIRVTSYVPYQSGVSSAIALSIPLDGRSDIFLSYCIALGYGQLEYDSPNGINPDPNKTIYRNIVHRKRSVPNSTLLTRHQFFRIFSDILKDNGYNANYCLLKAICETSQYQFSRWNGVLGDILYILFSPTTSKDERLSEQFYEAEINGQSNSCNKNYGSKCPISIFDLIITVRK